MRILVVEDEPTLNRLVTEKLKLARYSVDSCLDGEDALAHLACAEYDALILDIMLPKIDGLTVLRRLRPLWRRDPIPIPNRSTWCAAPRCRRRPRIFWILCFRRPAGKCSSVPVT